jgi:hypothetical protein
MAQTTVRVFNVLWLGSNASVASIEYSFQHLSINGFVTKVQNFVGQISRAIKANPIDVKLTTNKGLKLNAFKMYNDDGKQQTYCEILDAWQTLLSAHPPSPTPIQLFVTRRSRIDLAIDSLWLARFSWPSQLGQLVQTFGGMAPHLRNHYRVARAAVLCYYLGCSPREKLDSTLMSNKKFIMTMLQRCASIADTYTCHSTVLAWASDELRDTKDVVMAAVQINGYALGFASPRLRDQIDVVLAAVTKDARAIKWASARLQEEDDVLLAALKTRPSVVQNGALAQHCNEFWAKALRINGKVFNYMPRMTQTRLDNILTLVKSNLQQQEQELCDTVNGGGGLLVPSQQSADQTTNQTCC